MIEVNHQHLSAARQCALLGLCRSSFYYEPAAETAENLRLMKAIDAHYTRCPFYGSRRLTAVLRRDGAEVNRKRVQRLMQVMGLEAIYPKRSLSAPGDSALKFPYLLRGVRVERPNQVWSVDITYLPMRAGFMYLVALLDWFSRYVLAWRLSNSLDASFCLEALDDALEKHSAPDIHNNDQGSQFTSAMYVERLQTAGVRISWDGRGRVYDNIFVERLWRSVKYEHVYLHEAGDGQELTRGLREYFQFYNHQRPHQALAYRTPSEVYWD
jgi:putative transposase